MTPAISRAVALGAIAVGVLAASCATWFPNKPPPSGFTCADFPTLTPEPPRDVDVPDHPNLQCFAWQEFIALNWPAAKGRAGEPDRTRGASQFGRPNDSTPLVWETFKEAHEVFLPDAEPPRPWGESGLLRSLPAGFSTELPAELGEQAEGFLALRMLSKASPRAPRLERVRQAGSGAWLTSQPGRLTHYGIYMNRPAFQYIVDGALYDAGNQRGTQIDFPSGSSGATPAEGAMVLKSAWVELPSRKLRHRFHTVEACIVEGERCRMALVGLVGLHIVHKTETFPQWSWATFEHVDNAPDHEEIRQGTVRRRYTYFDPTCPTGGADPRCVRNRRPTQPMTRPVQVVRETPIAETSRLLNDLVHREIRRANRSSVWQYYHLVDVQWPQAGERVSGVRNAPLPRGGMTPTSIANAVIETYTQHDTCIDCHRYASIAATAAGGGSAQASDYSFLLMLAQEPP
ncbi:MAG TPA: hypothetical protein VMN39_03400 [Longimicrobiaceae bacterium]|nr:hypothetical protein [Longimicrobiaceae bacterium]